MGNDVELRGRIKSLMQNSAQVYITKRELIIFLAGVMVATAMFAAGYHLHVE